jgi:hypothetical protein
MMRKPPKKLGAIFFDDTAIRSYNLPMLYLKSCCLFDNRHYKIAFHMADVGDFG